MLIDSLITCTMSITQVGEQHFVNSQVLGKEMCTIFDPMTSCTEGPSHHQPGTLKLWTSTYYSREATHLVKKDASGGLPSCANCQDLDERPPAAVIIPDLGNHMWRPQAATFLKLKQNHMFDCLSAMMVIMLGAYIRPTVARGSWGVTPGSVTVYVHHTLLATKDLSNHWETARRCTSTTEARPVFVVWCCHLVGCACGMPDSGGCSTWLSGFDDAPTLSPRMSSWDGSVAQPRWTRDQRE